MGGRRDRDRTALRRIYRHLAPGGALVLSHWLPYEGANERRWARWLPGHRTDVPGDWPTEGERRRTADGDEIELISRLAALDPLNQVQALEMRARLWHDGQVVAQEEHALRENLYFAQELLLMLVDAGFEEVTIEAGTNAVRRRPTMASSCSWRGALGKAADTRCERSRSTDGGGHRAGSTNHGPGGRDGLRGTRSPMVSAVGPDPLIRVADHGMAR